LYDRARLREGQTVLIHAGAGGVGHVAIQLAKLKGARVIATVGSPEKAALCRELGADELIDYRTTDFVMAVNELTAGIGADIAFDTVGPAVLEKSIGCTAHFGDLVTLLDLGDSHLGEARMRNLRIGFELMLTPMLRGLDGARDHHVAILSQCTEWIEQGKLRIQVSRTLPLAEASTAHEMIETGHTTGKIVLRVA
jgi:NADPH2:quinone reductase